MRNDLCCIRPLALLIFMLLLLIAQRSSDGNLFCADPRQLRNQRLPPRLLSNHLLGNQRRRRRRELGCQPRCQSLATQFPPRNQVLPSPSRRLPPKPRLSCSPRVLRLLLLGNQRNPLLVGHQRNLSLLGHRRDQLLTLHALTLGSQLRHLPSNPS